MSYSIIIVVFLIPYNTFANKFDSIWPVIKVGLANEQGMFFGFCFFLISCCIVNIFLVSNKLYIMWFKGLEWLPQARAVWYKHIICPWVSAFIPYMPPHTLSNLWYPICGCSESGNTGCQGSLSGSCSDVYEIIISDHLLHHRSLILFVQKKIRSYKTAT